MLRVNAGTFVLATALAAANAEARQVDLILVGARVLTSDSTRPTAEAVALEGERIRAVGSNEDIRRLGGPKTRVVDLRGRTVIPGLIDAHVHLLIAADIVDEPSLRNYERTALPKVLAGFISHGITTVRSTGDPLPYIAELRSRMESAVTGPRVVITGPIPSSPGGHPATTVCRNNPFCRQGVAREVESPEQAREAVRDIARAKVNAVKIVVDDVIAKVPPLSDPILGALIDETHRLGLRIVAHVSVANEVALSKRLIELGLDEFVHPPIRVPNPTTTEISQAVAMLADRRIPVTTTLSGFDGYKDAKGVERGLIGGSPYGPLMRERFEAMLANVGSYSKAGVKLVVGTDWFNGPTKLDDPRILPGAFTIHEMNLLRRAGLSTPAVLTAATRNAAEALGVIDTLGTITEGKLADLVVLDGDLQQDFSALSRTVVVFKGGRIAHGSLP